MGWNSFDCYGSSVTEAEVLAEATAMAPLRAHGWDHVVVDYQWYDPSPNPLGWQHAPAFAMDAHGRLQPAEDRFPCAAGGRGFAPLAQRVHALGLKFGFHILRGIPRAAVARDCRLPNGHALAEIADPASTCAWNPDMVGVRPDHPAAQAWYDAIVGQYATWGCDYLKLDDASHPFHAAEVALVRRAIDRCGRAITLSLSPGPAPIGRAAELRALAECWRISADYWDTWDELKRQFELCAAWAPHGGDGRWADADMLPLGHLAIRNPEHGLGERDTRLSRDEQTALMTLWVIARSPLMMGGSFARLDPWTRALLSNDEALAPLKRGRDPRETARDGVRRVWRSTSGDGAWLALFNLGDEPTRFSDLADTTTVRDCWQRRDVRFAEVAEVAAHGARLLRLR